MIFYVGERSKDFLEKTPEVQAITAKIQYMCCQRKHELQQKWYYIKIRSFCTVKETVNEIKRQPTKWDVKGTQKDSTLA